MEILRYPLSEWRVRLVIQEPQAPHLPYIYRLRGVPQVALR